MFFLNNFSEYFLILIVLLPLIGSFVAGFGSFFIGTNGALLITISLISLSTLIAYTALYTIGLKSQIVYIDLLTWIDSGMFSINWGLFFDSLSIVMIIVVNTVSLIVHIYSYGYMEKDPHLARFMAYLSFFTFFMLFLVTANNFIQLFLGWEGVGLCSYLLIGFWYTRIQATKSAIKALLLNKIGDFGVLVGIICTFLVFQSINFSTVFALVPYFFSKTIFFLFWEVNVLTLISFLFFIGAVGKSAQLGLHTWLPDAMEGPTPVSALIHAATMVTAGVFLIIRCSQLFEYAPTILSLITFVGSITAFFAATAGVVQNDLKKVIAYSTCSQLGYMVFSCGLSGYAVSLFHLANHAFFKALLFLSAGCVIHSMSDEQDMRKMGGLIKLLPLTYIYFLIGTLALIGFPFLTGFYSKDVILEIAYVKFEISSIFSYWFGILTAGFTAFYSFRLLFLTFISETNAYKSVVKLVHESSAIMMIPLLVLVFGSIFLGYLGKDMFLGLGSDFFLNSIFVHPKNLIFIDAEFIPYHIKLVPLVFSFSGIILCFVFYLMFLELNQIWINIYMSSNKNIIFVQRFIYKFLSKKWFFDNVYNLIIVKFLFQKSFFYLYKLLDKGVIEFFGPYGFYVLGSETSNSIRHTMTGNLNQYVSFMLKFSIFFILFFNIITLF
jgi:NADH-ubiquinone oxidoreductase chain 5